MSASESELVCSDLGSDTSWVTPGSFNLWASESGLIKCRKPEFRICDFLFRRFSYWRPASVPEAEDPCSPNLRKVSGNLTLRHGADITQLASSRHMDILASHHAKKGESSTRRYFERETIFLWLLFRILLYLLHFIIIHLLLCPIYKLNFIIGAKVWGKTQYI